MVRKIWYMDVQNERISTLFTTFEQWEEEACSLLAAQYRYCSCLWMCLSSESSVSSTVLTYDSQTKDHIQ